MKAPNLWSRDRRLLMTSCSTSSKIFASFVVRLYYNVFMMMLVVNPSIGSLVVVLLLYQNTHNSNTSSEMRCWYSDLRYMIKTR